MKTKSGDIAFWFDDEYNIEIVEIKNNKNSKYVYVVGELESIDFVPKLRKYIECIEKKKNIMDK